jgi:hypothetical protein
VGSAPAWLAEHVLAERDEIDGPIRLNVLVGRSPEWTTPGLLLLGDAAHPMSPVRAQGINLALRDAVVAANHLVPVLREGAEPSALDAACRAVQAEREPEIVRAQKLQIREAAGQGDARSGSWRFEFAKRAARLLGRYRWVSGLRATLDSALLGENLGGPSQPGGSGARLLLDPIHSRPRRLGLGSPQALTHIRWLGDEETGSRPDETPDVLAGLLVDGVGATEGDRHE